MMKNKWSRKWISSVQPRKQRKYAINAPLHAKRKMVSAGLAPELRKRFGRRSMVIRKGDEVRVMRGDMRGKTGTVEKVDIKKGRIHVEGLKRKKVDGSEIPLPIQPSNVQITKLVLEDKKRQAVLQRSERPEKKEKSGD
jgi:large subunit ribosomal protein L24